MYWIYILQKSVISKVKGEYMDYTGERQMSLEKYKEVKISMLKRQFYVPITDEQEEYLNNLQSEIAVDNYARSLMY